LRGLCRADAIIAISMDTKRSLVRHLGISQSKIHVVYCGVDHHVFHPQTVDPDFLQRYDLPECRYILHVGSEEPRKNIHRLLQAFVHLKDMGGKVKFLKVGKPIYMSERERLLQAIKDLDLSDDVILVNRVSDGDLALFYNLADVFVFPSFHEGFGLPVLEAMACGTPVVCSNTAALPEIVGDTGIQVDPDNHEALAIAMKKVLTDSSLADEMSHQGKERSHQFTWQRTARETLEVYNTLLKEEIL